MAIDESMNAAAIATKLMGPRGGTPVGVSDVPQYQLDSAPQPVTGKPNAVTAPGGTHSHTGSGSDAHNVSMYPGSPLPGAAPAVSAVDAEAKGPKGSVG